MNATHTLNLPPEATGQLEWETCPECGGYGGTCILKHDGSPHGREHCRGAQWRDCVPCNGVGKRLAPRQVVALREMLTVPCPTCGGDGWDPTSDRALHSCAGCWDRNHARAKDYRGSGRVPLPDGIYQLGVGTCRDHNLGQNRDGWGNCRTCGKRDDLSPLGSPVRVTHKPWENVIRQSVFSAGKTPAWNMHLIVDDATYDRLAARPHGGGVLLVEEAWLA